MKGSDDFYETEIDNQVELAIDESDIIIFLVDVSSGITSMDYEISELLRKTKKKVFLVVNKVETSMIEKKFFEEDINFFGLPNIIFVSSEHRLGIEKVFTALEEICQENQLESIVKEQSNTEKEPINIAIIGRPNVGKSTLVNSIINQKRLMDYFLI